MTALGKLIQYALLAGVLVIVFVFIRGQHGVRMQASKRLAFFAFALLNVYAVLRPDDVTRVAKLVGVGRGTDLLLYLLVAVFLYVVVGFYLKFRDVERQLTVLARRLAIDEATQRQQGIRVAAVPPASSDE